MKHGAQGLRMGLVLGTAVALAGCAAMQQRVGGWFGTPTPTPRAHATPSAAGVPRVYYAGADGLAVYSGASASSKVVGKLALHEKVTRFKLERGYAYVESDTGVKGWVTNAQLIWRLPAAPARAGEAPAEPRPEEPAAPAPEAPEAPPVVEPTAPAVPPPPPPTHTPAPAAPTMPTATPRGAAPSIFDAY